MSSFNFEKERLMILARDTAKKFGIPEDLFLKQINQESGWNTKAKSGVGAQGLVQIMPNTAKSWGVNPADLNDPVKNLNLAARIMQKNLKTYNNDPILALAAYNGGSGAIDFAKQKLGKKDITGAEWVAFNAQRALTKGRDPNAWHTQTLDYVKKITGDSIHNIDKMIHPQKAKQIVQQAQGKAPIKTVGPVQSQTFAQTVSPEAQPAPQEQPKVDPRDEMIKTLIAHMNSNSGSSQVPPNPTPNLPPNQDPEAMRIAQQIQQQQLAQQQQAMQLQRQQYADTIAKQNQQQEIQRQQQFQGAIAQMMPQQEQSQGVQLQYQTPQSAQIQAQTTQGPNPWQMSGNSMFS